MPNSKITRRIDVTTIQNRTTGETTYSATVVSKSDGNSSVPPMGGPINMAVVKHTSSNRINSNAVQPPINLNPNLSSGITTTSSSSSVIPASSAETNAKRNAVQPPINQHNIKNNYFNSSSPPSNSSVIPASNAAANAERNAAAKAERNAARIEHNRKTNEEANYTAYSKSPKSIENNIAAAKAEMEAAKKAYNSSTNKNAKALIQQQLEAAQDKYVKAQFAYKKFERTLNAKTREEQQARNEIEKKYKLRYLAERSSSSSVTPATASTVSNNNAYSRLRNGRSKSGNVNKTEPLLSGGNHNNNNNNNTSKPGYNPPSILSTGGRTKRRKRSYRKQSRRQ